MHFEQRVNGHQSADPVPRSECRIAHHTYHRIELPFPLVHLKQRNPRVLVVDFLLYTVDIAEYRGSLFSSAEVSKEWVDIFAS